MIDFRHREISLRRRISRRRSNFVICRSSFVNRMVRALAVENYAILADREGQQMRRFATRVRGACSVKYCYQAFTLKLRLLSIPFTSELFESGRKMSEIPIFCQLTRNRNLSFALTTLFSGTFLLSPN